MKNLGLEICSQYEVRRYLGAMTIQQTLFDHINETQLEDPKIMELIQHRDEENETNAFDTEIY
jgi:hypothetical protein